MHSCPSYPKEPPVIHFVSQINLPGVSHTDGAVDKNAIGILRDWESIANQLSKNPRPKEDPLSLEAALIAIRKCVLPVAVRHKGPSLTRTPIGTWKSIRSCHSHPRGRDMRSTRGLSDAERGRHGSY